VSCTTRCAYLFLTANVPTVKCRSFSEQFVTVALTRRFIEFDQCLVPKTTLRKISNGRRPANFVTSDCYLVTSDLWGAHQLRAWRIKLALNTERRVGDEDVSDSYAVQRAGSLARLVGRAPVEYFTAC